MGSVYLAVAVMAALVVFNNLFWERRSSYCCPICGTRDGEHRSPCPRAKDKR